MFRSMCLSARDFLHARLHRPLADKLGFPFQIVRNMPLSIEWPSFISSEREGIYDPNVIQGIAYVSAPHLHSVIKARSSNHIHDRKRHYLLTQVSSSKSTYQQYKSITLPASIMYSSISSIKVLLLALLHYSDSVHAVGGRLSRRQSSTPVALWDPCYYPSQGINGPLPCASGSECICKDDSTCSTTISGS